MCIRTPSPPLRRPQPEAPDIDFGTIGSQQYAIGRLPKKLSAKGRLKRGYEAGPCGHSLSLKKPP
jgi:hypothetical protein